MLTCISAGLACCSRRASVSWRTCLNSDSSVCMSSVTRPSKIATYVLRHHACGDNNKPGQQIHISPKQGIHKGERQHFKTSYFCQCSYVRMLKELTSHTFDTSAGMDDRNKTKHCCLKWFKLPFSVFILHFFQVLSTTALQLCLI